MKKYIFIIILINIILILLFFINRNNLIPLTLPIDDAWGRVEYSRLLVHEKTLHFNTGMNSAGAFSPLWILLLTPSIILSLNPACFCIALSVFGGIIFDLSLFFIIIQFYQRQSEKPPYLISFFSMLPVTISGVNLWYKLSGMETLLFFSLVLIWILALSEMKLIKAGIICSAAILIRIEGVFLLALEIILLANLCFNGQPAFNEQFKERRQKKGVIFFIFLPVLAVFIQYIYNSYVSGDALYLIHTINLKRYFMNLPWSLTSWSFKNNVASFLDNWTWFIAYNVWNGAWIETVFPCLGGLTPKWTYFLFFLGCCGFFYLFQGKNRASLLFCEWFILHNLLYSILIPEKGTMGRYQAVNALFPWCFMIIGLYAISEVVKRPPGFKNIPLKQKCSRAVKICSLMTLFIIVTDLFQFTISFSSCIFNVFKIFLLTSCAILLLILLKTDFLKKFHIFLTEKIKIHKFILISGLLFILLLSFMNLAFFMEFYCRIQERSYLLKQDADSLISTHVRNPRELVLTVMEELRQSLGSEVTALGKLRESEYLSRIRGGKVLDYLGASGFKFVLKATEEKVIRGRRQSDASVFWQDSSFMLAPVDTIETCDLAPKFDSLGGRESKITLYQILDASD